MDKTTFVKLCSRAWALPALAALKTGVSARVAPVAHATGAGRTAMGHTFTHLLDRDCIKRNPGHGHPLRPEFVLTDTGKRAATMASDLLSTVTNEDERAILRKAWTLPIFATLEGKTRYADMRTLLSPITDRSLLLALKDMQAHQWVARSVDAVAAPPAVYYDLTPKGTAVQKIVSQILDRQ